MRGLRGGGGTTLSATSIADRMRELGAQGTRKSFTGAEAAAVVDATGNPRDLFEADALDFVEAVRCGRAKIVEVSVRFDGCSSVLCCGMDGSDGVDGER